ncbi:MAG: phosphatidylglycerophosphatase A, partial [Luminiphilus sp.]|nr:phosphatidylglycerophosphatase A [Luminiphilus sp.]
DIAKPWPISWCDRSVKGGLGVMLDDVVAALPAGLITALIVMFTAS